MKKSKLGKLNDVDFSTSMRIIDSGLIRNEYDFRILIFLGSDGVIYSVNSISDFSELKGIVLFFEDVFENIKHFGNFINFGINAFPVSYTTNVENDVIQLKQFDSIKDFKQRLNILRKEYYDLMLEYLGI